MKKNYFLILIVLGFFSCQKEVSTELSNTNTTPQVDVYIAGADSLSDWSVYFYSTYGIPVYWKNGKPTYYTDGTNYSYFGGAGAEATSIAVSGNDVYMTGYIEICGFRGCHNDGLFWKNGVFDASLDLPSVATSLKVSNNDVYIAGSSQYLTGNGGNAGYLKNKDHIELLSGSAGAVSTAIAVSGNDVYVAGIGITGFGGNYIAKYWKNGNVITLTDGTNRGAQAWSIAVSGNDAYVAGMEWNGNTYQDAYGNPNQKAVAKYWKNGSPVILSDGSNDAWTTSIAVSGTDVYVAGMEWNGQSYQDANGYPLKKSIAKYWKNGKAINLTDGTEDAVARSIAVSGTDVYVAGMQNGYATYWKNGVAVKLSNAKSDATSIFLVKN